MPGLVAIVLAIAMTLPLLFHLGNETQLIDSYDPLYLSWQVAWLGHALLHEPLHLLQSNLYWPIKDNLTFTDVLFGYAPAGLFATSGPHAALVVHNLLFIFTYALAFLGAFLLARELGAGTWGSIAAGAAFAYAPWKLEQNGHLHVLSSGGIPLALYLLLRGYRRGSGRAIIGGWLVAAWQMTLGFNLGLQFAYLLLVLGAVVVARWLQQERPRPSAAVLRTSVVGIAVFATITALVATPYLRVRHDNPEAKMPPSAVAFFSPPPRAFLAASSRSLIWGGPTAHEREAVRSTVEQTLFPGLTVLLLALVGLVAATYPPGLRLGLATGTVICGVLSLGLPNATHPDQGFTPYRFLYEYAPGWDSVRTPGRINNLTSLGLALLAGAGLALIVRRVRRLSIGASAQVITGAAVVAAILVEGFGPMPHGRVPPLPPGQLAAPAPQLNLPTVDVVDGIYAFWSIGGFPKMANAASSFDPRIVAAVRATSASFPDAPSVRFLRQIGVRSVILHRDLAFGTAWQNTGERSIAGLGITRLDEGDLVIYKLGT
jgi:hypothetical protein